MGRRATSSTYGLVSALTASEDKAKRSINVDEVSPDANMRISHPSSVPLEVLWMMLLVTRLMWVVSVVMTMMTLEAPLVYDLVVVVVEDQAIADYSFHRSTHHLTLNS